MLHTTRSSRRGALSPRLPALALTALATVFLAACAGPEATPTGAASPGASADAPEASAAPSARPRRPPRALSQQSEDPKPVAERVAAQLATLPDFKAFHEFRFHDGLAASGIEFRGGIVADAGRDYKLVHYDHGCGMAAGDVDNDGLPDLYFLTQTGSNELWRNLGGGRFEDWTKRAGVAMPDAVSVSAMFADYDNDADADLFVTTVRHGNHLFRNEGGGRFEDVSRSAGVDYSGHSSGASFLDFDRDGDLDLVVTNVGQFTSDETGPRGYYVGRGDAFSAHMNDALAEPSLLYRNLGNGKFEEVSASLGFVERGWTGDVAVHDVNEDGFVDLYLTNMQGDDRLWLNQAGQGFVEKTAEHFPKTSWGAMGVQFLDWNNDGNQDLYTTDMHSDMFFAIDAQGEKQKTPVPFDIPALQGAGNNVFGNAFYSGRGGGAFEEQSDALNVETYWPWGASAGDLNADGYEDLVVTGSMNYPWRYHYNSILLNDHGQRFRDAEFVLGFEPRSGGRTHTAWFEVDCSGVDRSHGECKGKTGKTTVLGALGSRASVLLDIDGDGDLDIVTNEFNSEPQVLLSDLAAKRDIRYLQLRLIGSKSSRDALGARVSVVAGDMQQTQILDGNLGYLSHGVLPLYFGLGDAVEAERIEIRWPSGVLQVIEQGIPAEGLFVISEPAA